MGLATALFLLIAGLTGAIIAWEHELDALLNPDVMRPASRGPVLSPVALADALEVRDPRVEVTYLPLAAEAGEALALFVSPRRNPTTGRSYSVDYNQVFVDPVTGVELGRRLWGTAWPITRLTFIPFLYKLHYTLHIPTLWGAAQWGMIFMGGVAVVWLVDSFVGFYLTLPAGGARRQVRLWWQKWKPAWRIKRGAKGHRRILDLHRAFGLWLYGLILLMAVSAIALSLDAEVFRPILSTLTNVTASPEDARPVETVPPARHANRAVIVEQARAEADRRGWAEPLAALHYEPARRLFVVYLHGPGAENHVGLGPSRLYFDSETGAFLGTRRPLEGTVGDLILDAQFPLHSGQILGLAGRILVTLLGLVVAVLSGTGVLIWWRKRAARRYGRRHAVPLPRGNLQTTS